MATLPLPQDGAGVPYLANQDLTKNLAVPVEQHILSNGIYLPISAANPLPTSVTGSLKNVIVDETGALKTVVSGLEVQAVTATNVTTKSAEDLRGLAANKPAANTVSPGTTYWSADTDPHGNAIEVSNGTSWVVV